MQKLSPALHAAGLLALSLIMLACESGTSGSLVDSGLDSPSDSGLGWPSVLDGSVEGLSDAMVGVSAVGPATGVPFVSIDAGLDATVAMPSVGRVPVPGAFVNGADIETVTIEGRNVSTGIITLKEPYPVLLLRDGTACLDVNFVARTDDVTTHRAQYPKQWLTWKRENGRIALLWSNGWFYTYFGGELPPQPRGTKLNGKYKYANSFAVGDVVRVTERSFQFSEDGRFVFGAETAFSTGNAAGGNFPPNQRGAYEIDGYLMRLQYDDGGLGTASFVHGGKTIYINGTWYAVQGS